MTTSPTPDEVAAAAAAWVWVPDDARQVRTGELWLVRYPDWFTHPLQLVELTPSRPLAEVAQEVLERARREDAGHLVWWVKLGADPGTDELVVGLGGEADETVDVFAADLVAGMPDLGSAAEGVTLRWEDDAATVRDSHEVSAVAFDGTVPPPEELDRALERARVLLAADGGGTVVAYLDGEPVGSGGISLVDGVARLWGGGVLPAARGRGVYRAILAERIRYALDRGATMALVKGRVETSGPILRRAGFAAYGQERSYRVPL